MWCGRVSFTLAASIGSAAGTLAWASGSAGAQPAVPAGAGVAEADGTLFVPGAAYAGWAALSAPVVGWASRPRGGAWEVASDGGVFARRAPFYGSLGRVRLARPIVAVAATPTGRGYWLVGSDGGVFSFGDARFRGSLGRVRVAQPIVAATATPTGRGYWLVGSDGGVFSFGDARFYGSLGRVRVAQPIVAVAATPTGRGYWLVGSDGGVFSFGDARFYGSTAGRHLAAAVGVVPAGAGYDVTLADGSIWQFLPGARPYEVTRLPVPAAYAQMSRLRQIGAEVVATALAQVGKPYVLGGNGPAAFDCSGLSRFAYAAAGIMLPRTSQQQFAAVPHVPLASALPGDLLFFYPGITHVGIYLGNGLMVDAPHPGAVVRVEAFSPWFGPVVGIGRPALG
jgi:NlpC/P60 family